MALTTLRAGEDGTVVPASRPDEVWRRCVNAEAVGCNWLVPVEAEDPRCPACRLNRNLADMNVPAQPRQVAGARMRQAAAPLCAAGASGCRSPRRRTGEKRGLAFDFLEGSRGAPVMTGHANGLITINISEADSAERERQRLALGEPYRTLLGHMRHEAGHYYWDLLVADGGRLEECRALFGDERESYAEALERYYEHGPKPGWEEGYISAYATMHPWEDFAETWTHYLHMVDTLDTGASFGLSVNPTVGEDPRNAAVIDFDPYRPPDLASLTRAWLPLTAAVNSLNRSMGQPDLYPFDPSPGVLGEGALHPRSSASAAARTGERSGA